MSADNLLLNAVYRRIEAYEEKWHHDHNAAQLCQKFEGQLCAFAELFRVVVGIDETWREDVFRAEIEYSAEMDSRIKGLFERWVGCNHLLLKFFESQNYTDGINGATEHRECLKKAKNILADWTKPEPSTSIVLHTLTLNEEQAKAFRHLLVGP
jgi:hypothetical protein